MGRKQIKNIQGNKHKSICYFSFLYLILLALLLSCRPAHAENYTLPDDFGSGPFSSCFGFWSTYSCSGDITFSKTTTITLTEEITLSIFGGDFIAEKNFSIINNGHQLNLEVWAGNVTFRENTEFYGDIELGFGSITFEEITDFYGNIRTVIGNIQVTNNNSDFTGDMTTFWGSIEIDDGSWVIGVCTPQDSKGIDSCSDGEPEPAAVDHYEIRNDGSALTCSPETILIAACKNSDCSELATENSTITLSPSGWEGGNEITFQGSTSVDLRRTTAQTVTLEISDPSPAATNGYSCVDAIGGSSVSCDLQFFDSGFDFSIPTQTSCKPSESIVIQAVRKDDTGTHCVPAFANRTETINFWSSYVSPAAGNIQLEVNSTEVATTSPGTGISLDFDENGQAILELLYSDAGQLQLDASFQGTGDEIGLKMTGNSHFIIRPAGLCVYSDAASSDCASGDGTCTSFVAAGTPFSLKIKGVCWQSDTETDTDFCDTNSTTLNYNHSGIAISHNLIAPATGVTGNITTTSAGITSAGEVEIQQIVSEVGVFTFTANPSSAYLGIADIFSGSTFTSENIGRFTPDHFELAITPDPPVLAETCLVYTYLGETFDWQTVPNLTIQAMNGAATPAVTENYEGDFFKLDATLSYSYVDNNVPGPQTALTPASSSQTMPDTSDCGGMVSIALLEDDGISGNGIYDGFSYIRPLPDQPVSPFEPDITMTFTALELTDSDSVCYQAGGGCQPFTVSGITGTHLRHGRSLAEAVFGPETGPLIMPISTYWYDGAAWVNNDDDNCSEFSYSLTPSGITVTGSPANPIQLTSGSGDLTLSPAANSTRGTVSVECDFDTWLEPDPTGVATFGISRGNDRIINWQEVVR